MTTHSWTKTAFALGCALTVAMPLTVATPVIGAAAAQAQSVGAPTMPASGSSANPMNRWAQGLRGEQRRDELARIAAEVRYDNPADDRSFYHWNPQVDSAIVPGTERRSSALADFAPGAVLKTRELTANIQLKEDTHPTPIHMTQVLYRTTDSQGRPSANVTSVLQPPGQRVPGTVVYASYYDSLNPADHPSRTLAGNRTLGGGGFFTEVIGIGPHLAAGHRVIIPDIQGATANFGAGREYGQVTLDAIRASSGLPGDPVGAHDRVVTLGFSGGAIAAMWAGALAPQYAPDVNARLVGVAAGGLLVNPLNNLMYVQNSTKWSGVAAMAIVGLARAYGVDMNPYLSDYGKEVVGELNTAAITQATDRWDHLRWSELVRPEFPTPESIPELARIAADTNLGRAPAPTAPVLLMAADGGEKDGTPTGGENIGPGDGIMIRGDQRALAAQYCAAGTPVAYYETPGLAHTAALGPFHPMQVGWIQQRLHPEVVPGLPQLGTWPVPSTCGSIPPGNDLSRYGTGG